MKRRVQNNNGKGFFSELLYGIIYLIIVNVMLWLVWFVLNILTSVLVNELVIRSDAETQQFIAQIKSIVCIIVYCIVFVIVYNSNPVEKNRYIMAAYEDRKTPAKEFASYAVRKLPWNVLYYALFTLPLFLAIAADPEIAFFPSFYIAQFSLYELIGNVWLSYVVGIAAYAIFTAITVPLVQVFWYSKRMRL